MQITHYDYSYGKHQQTQLASSISKDLKKRQTQVLMNNKNYY